MLSDMLQHPIAHILPRNTRSTSFAEQLMKKTPESEVPSMPANTGATWLLDIQEIGETVKDDVQKTTKDIIYLDRENR